MSERQRQLTPTDSRGQPLTIGRYVLHRQIARGGMATIHIARLLGDEGFSRIVAAKRLHPAFAEDEEFVAMFLDEARIASKVRHRNVVPVLDVVTWSDEVILVQEYVHGVPLQWLLRALHQSKSHVPIQIAVGFARQVLAGLHAAHEAVDELGTPLQIVHRDVSPQNVMIAVDGSARLLDFGVAKAIMAAHITREGTYKGKLAYSAPEQLRGAATRQSDVYSLSVMFWELVVGHRMHRTAQNGAELVATIMNGTLPTIVEALEPERASGAIDEAEWRQIQLVDPIVQRGLALETRERWATALEMEEALAAALRPAAPSVAAAWVRSVGKEFLDARDWLIASEEASWRKGSTEVGRQVSATGLRTSSIRLRAQAGAGMGAGESEAGSFGGELEQGKRRRLGSFARGVAASAVVAALAALGNALFFDGAPSGAPGVGVTAARVVPALPQPALAPAPRASHEPSPSRDVAYDLARERSDVEAGESARERSDVEAGKSARERSERFRTSSSWAQRRWSRRRERPRAPLRAPRARGRRDARARPRCARRHPCLLRLPRRRRHLPTPAAPLTTTKARRRSSSRPVSRPEECRMTCARRIIATLYLPLLLAMIACIVSGAARAAAADEMSKEACVEAHSQGQDAREQGKLSLARKLFLTCAQSSCPGLVQSDCARFADELERYQPTLSFAARDGRGNDLPETSVYLDEVLVATRVDDGRPREVDPGRHVVRFSHGGRDQIVAIVVGSGEKGRTIVGTFDLGPAAPASGGNAEPAAVSAPRRRHSLGPRFLLGAGAAVTATGVALAVTGLVRVPSNCSLSSHDCAAPPGDKSLDDASKAVRLNNVGWAIGAVGAAALAGGLIWYAKDAKGERRERIVAPWFSPHAAGAQLRGRL